MNLLGGHRNSWAGSSYLDNARNDAVDDSHHWHAKVPKCQSAVAPVVR